MAYNPAIPPRLIVGSGIDRSELGCGIWAYSSPVDSLSTVTSTNYFSNGALYDMQVGDLVIVNDETNSAVGIYAVGRIIGFAVTLTTVKGSTDVTGYDLVKSGSAWNGVWGRGTLFQSASGAPKSLYLPPATGSMRVIEFADGYGDADVLIAPITAIPSGSDVIVGTQDEVYTRWGSLRLRDIAPGLILNV